MMCVRAPCVHVTDVVPLLIERISARLQQQGHRNGEQTGDAHSENRKGPGRRLLVRRFMCTEASITGAGYH